MTQTKSTTFVVSIGRNLSDTSESLSDVLWGRFKSCLALLLLKTSPTLTLHTFAEGTGYTNGQPETSATWVFSAHLNLHTRFDLEVGLSALAREFGQDSIALLEGTTQFVSADADYS
jgi:hypothetical protein